MVFASRKSDLFAPPKLLAGLAAVGLSGFAALAVLVSAGWTGADDSIAHWVDQYYDKSRNDALELVVYAGMALGAVTAVVVTGVLAARKRWQSVLFWAVVVGGVVVLDVILKEAFQRPSLVKGDAAYSFPSGNAMASVAFVAGLALLTSSARVRRRLLLAGIPAIVVYGALIVFLWWHYLSDVLAGWAIALAWVAVVALGMRQIGDSAVDRARVRGEQTRRADTAEAEPLEPPPD